jgi:hypothetical protein
VRTLIASFVVALVAATGTSHAQINVRLQTAQDTFLLYEAIPVILAIQNFSARTVELTGEDGKPWLSFLVTDESGNMVGQTELALPATPVLIPAGQTIAHTIDLLPYFQLRARGNFKVQAYISARGTVANSQPLRFTIMHGREIASVTKGLQMADGEKDQYRTYVLMARAMHSGDQLYALVRDDDNGRVFEMVMLGKYTPSVKPSMMVDREGSVHVLFQGAPRSFGYARITSEGRVFERKIFSDYRSSPELVQNEGEVSVVGGEQVYPKIERILTEEDLNPQPLPPIVKKKPWWKFWGSSTTNAPTKSKSASTVP